MYAVKDSRTTSLTTDRKAEFIVPHVYPRTEPIVDVAGTIGAFPKFDPRKAPADVMKDVVDGVRTPRASTPIPKGYAAGSQYFFSLSVAAVGLKSMATVAEELLSPAVHPK